MLLSIAIIAVMIAPISSQGQNNQHPLQVEVVNTPTVHDADNPARQPVQTFVSFDDPYVVPAGKRLVIEYFSGQVINDDGTVSSATLRTSTGGSVNLDHLVPLGPPTGTNGTQNSYQFGQLVRVYADPGTEVRAAYLYSGTGSVTVIGRISGHLVDVQ